MKYDHNKKKTIRKFCRFVIIYFHFIANAFTLLLHKRLNETKHFKDQFLRFILDGCSKFMSDSAIIKPTLKRTHLPDTKSRNFFSNWKNLQKPQKIETIKAANVHILRHVECEIRLHLIRLCVYYRTSCTLVKQLSNASTRSRWNFDSFVKSSNLVKAKSD